MPTPSAPAMPDMSMMQAAQPAPMAMPEIDPQTGMPVLPPFNRPGVASPAAMDRMPGYFARGTMPKLPGAAANKTTAPPLPPSIAKRFGF